MSEQELKDELSTALRILRLLHDYQNGCPLEKYLDEWELAMKDAESILKKHNQ